AVILPKIDDKFFWKEAMAIEPLAFGFDQHTGRKFFGLERVFAVIVPTQDFTCGGQFDSVVQNHQVAVAGARGQIAGELHFCDTGVGTDACESKATGEYEADSST